MRPQDLDVVLSRWEFISTWTLTHRRWAFTIAFANRLSAME